MSAMNVLEQYITATNTHDFENVKPLLHPKAIYWFSDKTCTTLEEIQHYFEDAWNTIKEEKYAASNIQWLVVEENTATCIYNFNYEGQFNGSFITGSGRATNVFVKDHEQHWKLVHEHLSSIK